MVGPVLHQEMRLYSRRNRLHVFRWRYAGVLVVRVRFFLSLALRLGFASRRFWECAQHRARTANARGTGTTSPSTPVEA